jgi:hypothetical protein
MMPAHANNITMLNVHDMLRSSTAAPPNCYKFQIASQQCHPGGPGPPGRIIRHNIKTFTNVKIHKHIYTFTCNTPKHLQTRKHASCATDCCRGSAEHTRRYYTVPGPNESGRRPGWFESGDDDRAREDHAGHVTRPTDPAPCPSPVTLVARGPESPDDCFSTGGRSHSSGQMAGAGLQLKAAAGRHGHEAASSELRSRPTRSDTAVPGGQIVT